MKKINYIELGATLFVPLTHKNIEKIVSGKKYTELRSVLLDTEDGLREDALDAGLSALKKLLLTHKKSKLLVFVRPKNVAVLQEILSYEVIEKIDGFILPKFSLTNAGEYFKLLEKTEFSIMPSIEGTELFEQSKLHELKEIILTNAHRIVSVRFGLEDIFRQLSLKRNPDESSFDLSALNAGLFSKTIIHPKQINALNELYRVTKRELYEAREIWKSKEAAFNLDGKMAESVTMKPYAHSIIKRAEVYGVTFPKEEQSQ